MWFPEFHTFLPAVKEAAPVLVRMHNRLLWIIYAALPICGFRPVWFRYALVFCFSCFSPLENNSRICMYLYIFPSFYFCNVFIQFHTTGIYIFRPRYSTKNTSITVSILRSGQYHGCFPRKPFRIQIPIFASFFWLHRIQAVHKFFISFEPWIPSNAALLRTAGYSSMQWTGKIWSIVILSFGFFFPQYAHRYFPVGDGYFAKKRLR